MAPVHAAVEAAPSSGGAVPGTSSARRKEGHQQASSSNGSHSIDGNRSRSTEEAEFDSYYASKCLNSDCRIRPVGVVMYFAAASRPLAARDWVGVVAVAANLAYLLVLTRLCRRPQPECYVRLRSWLVAGQLMLHVLVSQLGACMHTHTCRCLAKPH